MILLYIFLLEKYLNIQQEIYYSFVCLHENFVYLQYLQYTDVQFYILHYSLYDNNFIYFNVKNNINHKNMYYHTLKSFEGFFLCIYLDTFNQIFSKLSIS